MKRMIVLLLVGLALLSSCQQNTEQIPTEINDDKVFEMVEVLEGGNDFYITEAIRLTKEAGELAKTDEYIALYTGDDEVSEEIKSVADIDFDNPVEILYIHFDSEKAVEFMQRIYEQSGQEEKVDFERIIEFNRFGIHQFATMINARYGAKMIAATTVLSKSRGYIKPVDFEKNFSVYLKYDGEFSSVVSFNEYGDGVISANMTFVKNGEGTIDVLMQEIASNLGEESITVETVEREN